MPPPVIEFDAVPDVQFDAIPDAPQFDAVPDEPLDPVVEQEAARATVGGLQALDVMSAPRAFDWTEVAEVNRGSRLAEALVEADALRAQGVDIQSNNGAVSFTAAETASPEAIKRAGGVMRRIAAEKPEIRQAPQTYGPIGDRIQATIEGVAPIFRGATDNAGAATGGALGTALFAIPQARGIAMLAPMVGALGGSILGSGVQEEITQAIETPEQTAARQAESAIIRANNPKSYLLGQNIANLPFFRPGLADFGRAAAGDAGAIRNLGIAGFIGGGMEVAAAMYRGETAKAEDIAAGIFSNLILNEPSRLGRRLGIPSSVEAPAARATAEPPRTAISDVITPAPDRVSIAETFPVRETPVAPEFDAVPDAPVAVPEAPQGVVAPEGVRYDGVTQFGDEGFYSFSDTTSIPGRTVSITIESTTPPTPEQIRTAMDAKLGEFRGAETPTQSLSQAISTNRSAGNRIKLRDGSFEVLNPLGGVDADGVMTLNGFVDPTLVVELQNSAGDVLWSKPQSEAPASPAEPISPQPQTEAAPAPPSSGEPAARVGEEPPAPPAEPPTAGRVSEAPPELPGATSNKEAVVNAERAARELDPVIKEARISNSESIDRAQQVIQQNPLKPQEIVTRLRDNPHERTISLEDSAVLLVERARLNKTRQELLTRATDETLDPTERAAAKAEFNTIETQLNALDQAAQDARSTWGRFGQLHQRMIREDFTLAALERRARLEKGEPLTPEEAAQVKTIADEVAAEQAKADAAIAAAEVRQIEKGVDEAIATSAKQPDLEPAVKSLADRIMAKLDSQAEAARKRLRERFKSLGSAPDPLILADFTVLAATRIAKSAIKAGQWVSEMVKEFGENARPYLMQAYEAANSKLDELVASGTTDTKKRATVKAKVLAPGQQQERVSAAIAARVKEGESLDSLGNYIDRLTDAFIAGGIRDRQSLVAVVKGVLEPLSPGITDRKVGELISGYGRATTLSKDPLKVVKRDLKGQLQQISKLEALAAKEPLRKTGPERRTASDEERRLIKQVNEAKKAAGVVTTDPETQLKSTMDSARTRFANEIKDLTFQIETGTRPASRTPVQYDQDILVMRGLRDRLKETVQLLDGPRQLTEEQRIRITTRALQDSIATIEKRMAGQQPQTRRAAPDTPEIRALRAKRDALREELNEITAADALLQENRKAEALVRSIEAAEAELAGTTSRPGRPQGPESELVTEARAQLAQVREQLQAKRDADPLMQQERMDAAEAAVEKAIRKLDEQLQAGDISVQRAPTPAGSQRLEDLRLQRDAMIRLRNQLRNEARPKPNPLDVAIKARKSALARQEADYEARIAAGDFAPRTRKPPIDLSSDPAAMDALARVQAVKDKFTKLQKEWELNQMNWVQKLLRRSGQAWDATANMFLTLDLSTPLQTIGAMASHPVEGTKAMWGGAKVFAQQFARNSDKLAKQVEQRIINSPNSAAYKAMGLELPSALGKAREENMASILEKLADLDARWAGLPNVIKGLWKMEGKELVKGGKRLGSVVPKLIGTSIKASNVAFETIANQMRARTADAMLARDAKKGGMPLSKLQLELLGEQVNVATGKGGLKGGDATRRLLFAPNYYLSIIKQLTLYPLFKSGVYNLDSRTAKNIATEYVRGAMTMGSVLGLAWLFGNREDMEFDPRHKDFLRAKTDKGTSIDITMGRGAWITAGAQILTGERVDDRGRVQDQDRKQTALNFAGARLSRGVSSALTSAFGKNYKGKDISAGEIAKDFVVPLSWRDFDDILKREGMTRGSFLQLLNVLGINYRISN